MTSIKEELATKPLTELVSLVRGVSYTKGVERREPAPGYMRLLRANNIQGDLVFNDVIYVPQTCVKPEQILKRGDIVVAMSSGSKSVVGKTAQHWHTDEPTTFGAFCGVLRPNASVVPAFLGWFLRTEQYRQFISEISAGVNINNLKREYFEQVEVPTPSLAQQEATAQIIDALVTATSSPRDRLATIPALLKKFRQSVLAAACSGQLTADWREEHSAPSLESEVAQRLPKKKSAARTTIESTDLNLMVDVPESWTWTQFQFVCDEITVGFVGSMTKEYVSDGVPFLRSLNVAPFAYKPENLRFIGRTFHEKLKKSQLRPGDLAIVRTGYAGACCVIPDHLVEANCSDLVIARPSSLLLADFGCLYINSSLMKNFIESNMVGIAQGHFNIGSFSVTPIALPPLLEQAEIVRRVESLFALADSIESRLAEATAQVERTTQAILAKAFRGELSIASQGVEPN